MFDFGHLSPEMYLLLEDDRTVKFVNRRGGKMDKPKPEECKGKIKGICFAYAFCGEQDFGIEPMAKAFRVNNMEEKVITETPFEVIDFQKVKALMFGERVTWSKQLVERIEEVGLVGYWDDHNLFIGVAPEYGFLIDAIGEMIQPRKAKFAFSKAGMMRHNLLIMEAK